MSIECRALRLPPVRHIQEFREKMRNLGAFLTAVEEKGEYAPEIPAQYKDLPCNCIDLKGKSPHKPRPVPPKQQALWDDLRAREDRGETRRYNGWSDAGSEVGVYNPYVNEPSTWLSDADAVEWYKTAGVKHIQAMQKYQETKMLHYLMQEKLKELRVLKDRLVNR